MRVIQFVRRSIAMKQFIGLLLTLIIPLTLATAFFGNRLKNELIANETASLAEKANICSANFEDVLQDMQSMISSLMLNNTFLTILKSTASLPTLSWYEDYKAMTTLLSTLATRSGTIYSINVLDASQKLYSPSNTYDKMSFDDPLIQLMAASPGNYALVNHQLAGYDSRNVISLGKAIVLDGQVSGYVWVDVPTAIFSKAFSPFHLENAIIYIAKDNIPLLYLSDALPFDHTLSLALNDSIQRHTTEVVLHDEPYLLMSHPINTMGFLVSVLVQKEAAFAKMQRVIMDSNLIMSVILCVSLLISVLHSRRLARNINRLQKSVSDFRNAPTQQVMTLLPRTQDEVGRLTTDFVAMSTYISELLRNQEAHERHKRELEFQSLQAQINPHMIYNVLQTISYLAQLQNAMNIDEL